MERVAYTAMAKVEEEHWWFVGRRAIIRSLIEGRIRPDQGSRILEAGCGTGGNLELLASFGSLQAFEHDQQVRNIAKNKTGFDVKAGSLPNGIGEIEGPFDLIALFDVLEHIEDDEASLRNLSTLMAPNGKLMLTVPALQFLWSSHDEINHHHRRYSRARLHRALKQADLHVEYITYFNSLLLPVAVLDRLFSRFFMRNPKGDEVPNKFLNFVFAKVFASESILLQNFRLPIGLSLCAICTTK